MLTRNQKIQELVDARDALLDGATKFWIHEPEIVKQYAVIEAELEALRAEQRLDRLNRHLRFIDSYES